MMKITYTPLHKRSIIKISGKDARTFLQGLITNDINKLRPAHAIYTCLLTPQGKYFADFFIYEHGGELWLDCSTKQKEYIIKRLTMYKLRSRVELNDMSGEYEVIALSDPNVKITDAISYTDPRVDALGTRVILKKGNNSALSKFKKNSPENYDRFRISLCVPDSDDDLIPEKSFPLQNRMDEMHAIDYHKGCYVGQEVTARTKHRGVVRKNLFTVKTLTTEGIRNKGNTDNNSAITRSCATETNLSFSGTDTPLPPAGAKITYGGKQVGEMRSSAGNIGLALLDIEFVNSEIEFMVEDIQLEVVN